MLFTHPPACRKNGACFMRADLFLSYLLPLELHWVWDLRPMGPICAHKCAQQARQSFGAAVSCLEVQQRNRYWCKFVLRYGGGSCNRKTGGRARFRPRAAMPSKITAKRNRAKNTMWKLVIVLGD